MDDEARRVKALSMRQQGSWAHWEGVRQRKVSWNDIWKMEGHTFSYLLRSAYDLMPSPINLFTWGIKDNAECVLCRKPANLAHVLTSCQVALSNERYAWRYDKVLKFVTFVKSGTRATRSVEAGGILITARDWEMRAGIQRRMGFPAEVASLPLLPDVVLWSRSSKQVVLVELIVPWEDRMKEANERKQQKYQQLVEECQHRGWKTWCLPTEVGCRGFPGQSLWRALRLLGVTGADRRNL
ncbi:uncharacterized protein [Argopecten irradians]|uniref:uncharacterized protein n=1 Tax=Argopecten irradians TaxID=31199 RepID=UPI00371628D2